MSLDRSFTKVVGVLIFIALPLAATPALARHDGERRGRAVHGDDEGQMRDLLAKLAAASGVPEPEERTDADLMYEAMLRWNGEPPDSAAIDQALANSKRDAARAKRTTQDMVRHMFWKDPFANDPRRLIPVRQENRELLDTYARKQRRQAREAREPRDEVSRLRAELAEAREENSRLRERSDMTAERQGCVADSSSSFEVRKRRPGGGSHVHSRRTDRGHAEIALASTVQTYQTPTAPVAPPTPVTPPAPTPAVPAHGIIIVPLPSPAPASSVVEARRRPGSRDRGAR